MLWHCTSALEFRQIKADGLIKPSDGSHKWGRHACQQNGAVPLFDFTTPTLDIIFEDHMLQKWPQFLGCAKPLTMVLGLDKAQLPGELIPYPRNKEGNNGNIIPWVEVCHRGAIPFSAIARYLLICAIDYSRFYPSDNLDDVILSRVEKEFAAAICIEDERVDKELNEPPDTFVKRVAREIRCRQHE